MAGASKITISNNDQQKPVDVLFAEIPCGTVFWWNGLLYAKVGQDTAVMIETMTLYPIGNKAAYVRNYRPVDLTITVTRSQA